MNFTRVFLLGSVIMSQLNGVAMAQSVDQTIDDSPCSTTINESGNVQVNIGDCTFINAVPERRYVLRNSGSATLIVAQPNFAEVVQNTSDQLCLATAGTSVELIGPQTPDPRSVHVWQAVRALDGFCKDTVGFVAIGTISNE